MASMRRLLLWCFYFNKNFQVLIKAVMQELHCTWSLKTEFYMCATQRLQTLQKYIVAPCYICGLQPWVSRVRLTITINFTCYVLVSMLHYAYINYIHASITWQSKTKSQSQSHNTTAWVSHSRCEMLFLVTFVKTIQGQPQFLVGFIYHQIYVNQYAGAYEL